MKVKDSYWLHSSFMLKYIGISQVTVTVIITQVLQS